MEELVQFPSSMQVLVAAAERRGQSIAMRVDRVADIKDLIMVSGGLGGYASWGVRGVCITPSLKVNRVGNLHSKLEVGSSNETLQLAITGRLHP